MLHWALMKMAFFYMEYFRFKTSIELSMKKYRNRCHGQNHVKVGFKHQS